MTTTLISPRQENGSSVKVETINRAYPCPFCGGPTIDLLWPLYLCLGCVSHKSGQKSGSAMAQMTNDIALNKKKNGVQSPF